MKQLEIVVAGDRQTAMPTTPDLTSVASPWHGFLVEQHRLPPLEMPDHWIPYYLLTVACTAEPVLRTCFEGGREQHCLVNDGDCSVVAPSELRRLRLSSSSTMIAVAIEPEVFESLVPQSSPVQRFELVRQWSGEDPALRTLVFQLQAELVSGCPTGSLLGDALCTQIAAQLIQRYSIGRVRLEQYKGGLPRVHLRRVVDFIEENLHKGLTVEEIAQTVALSKYHFGKAFKQSTGVTLHSYVLSRRMGRARQLLSTSDLPLVAVAQSVGFSNQSHFTASFTERIGIPPGAFRDQYRPVTVAVGDKSEVRV